MSAWENYHLEYSPYPLSGLATLNANPYFGTGSVSPWTPQNGATIAASTAQAHEGSWSMLVTPDGVTASPQAQSEEIATVTGVSYTLSGWLRSTADATRFVQVLWYDSSHAFLTSNTISIALVAGVWTRYGPSVFAAPFGASFARIKTGDAGTPAATNPWWADELTLSADVANIPRAWSDITSYALARSGPPIRIQAGVPPMGSTAQYATLWASLDNTDHRFTFGNTASPLSPNWKPGRLIRCFETIGPRRFDEFTGYMQPPEADDWAEQNIDQYVTVTAVDRLGWLARGRTFISTVSEYIRYQGGTALKGFWPLNDPAGSVTARQASQNNAGAMTLEGQLAGSVANPIPSMVVFGAVVPPAGDDASFVQGNPVVGATSIGAENRLVNRSLSSISWVTNRYVTLACWQFLTATNLLNGAELLLLRSLDLVNTIQLSYQDGNWQAAFANSTGQTGAVVGPPARLGTWDYLAAQVDNLTGAVAFWVNNSVSVANLPGASNGDVTQVALSWASIGHGIGHIQIYAGDVNAFTRTAFLAQQAMAVNGLAGQYTGQRIVTLAQYAGVPATELGLVDTGTSLMQKASLAGRNPLTAMRAAETTEQGRLRTNGQGLIVFDPRTRRYNS